MNISIRDQMVAEAAPDRPFFASLHMLGIRAFELQLDADGRMPHVRNKTGEAFNLSRNPGIAELEDALARQNVQVSALLLERDFSSRHDESSIRFAVQAIRLAEALGAACIRIDPLSRDKSLPAATIQNNLIASLRQILDQTPSSGVALAIENHGLIANDPDFLDAVLAALPESRVGMTLDTGNFYWWGLPLEEVYALLEKYAPRTRHTHIKSIHYPRPLQHTRRSPGHDYANACCALAEGDMDLTRLVRILRNANYPADLCIENESLGKRPLETRMGVLRQDMNALAKATSHP